MSEEEKKAIEYIRKVFIGAWRRKQQRLNTDVFQIHVDKEDIDTIKKILNLIEKQDKMIDLMSLAILNYDDQLIINRYRDIEQVKETFKEMVIEK